MPGRGSHLNRRLGSIPTLATIVLALTAAPALASFGYTANFEAGTVSRFDTATNQVVGEPIPVSPLPSTIAIAPDGKTAYVGSETSGDITVIDTRTNQPVGKISLNEEVAMLAISPDGTTAYVTRDNKGDVRALDLRTNQLTGPPIAAGGELWSVAFSPDGKFAFVGDVANDAVRVIDTQSKQAVGAPIPVGEHPVSIAFAPDGRVAYVADFEDGQVYAIDTQTRQVTAAIPVTGGGSDLYTLAITPDGTKAYAASVLGGSIYAIDLQTRQVISGPIDAGGLPFEVAITPDGRTVYVSSSEDGVVSAIDVRTNQIVKEIPIEGGVAQLAIVPNQSPVASFSAKPSKSTLRVGFASSATDPDGTVSIFDWGFGDGTTANNAGSAVSHTYKRGGKFTASLTVVDNEGCSTGQVFTGRTAYCSGSALSTQAKRIRVVPNRFSFGALTRNARKGTAKLRISVPAAGRVVLSGKQVRKVKRSAGKAGVVVLSIKPKAKLRSALASQGSAKAKLRVTFRPAGGQAFAKARSVQLRLN